jgi:hypothetical protein
METTAICMNYGLVISFDIPALVISFDIPALLLINTTGSTTSARPMMHF